jgi:hypothetical protein
LVSVFKVVFVFANMLNGSLMPLFCGLFFVIYMCLSVQQPVFAYSHEKVKKFLMSAVGFVSLCRVFGAIVGNSRGQILL